MVPQRSHSTSSVLKGLGWIFLDFTAPSVTFICQTRKRAEKRRSKRATVNNPIGFSTFCFCVRLSLTLSFSIRLRLFAFGFVFWASTPRSTGRNMTASPSSSLPPSCPQSSP
jgi:hypothetical protein